MKNGLVLIGIIFAISLAVSVGSRLSDEAMAVVVGAVCGVSASIPMAIGLAIAASQNRGRPANDQGRLGDRQEYNPGFTDRRAYSPQSPVVVISPPQPNAMYPYANSPYYFPPMTNDVAIKPREFKIVGEE